MIRIQPNPENISRIVRGKKRPGAVMVETALVAIIFFMFIFGVFEYCRLIFLEQMMQQAAREGARYMVVNTTDTTVVADTQAVVKKMMVGLENNYTYSCNVYKSDDTGKNIGNATDAKFGELIVVEVNCSFVPILPSFLYMSTIPLQVKCGMVSEAN